jgi:hypothetical protein
LLKASPQVTKQVAGLLFPWLKEQQRLQGEAEADYALGFNVGELSLRFQIVCRLKHLDLVDSCPVRKDV